ncbi:MAG: class I SAM-dependent methyltransferase [Deltaproteobacteria bacterium]|nr:class I SAM-dependent methyltransferase [Deltaproteobacteria bacterium]
MVLRRLAPVAVSFLVACGGSNKPVQPAAPHGPGHGPGHGHGGHAHGGPVHHRFDEPEKWAKVFDDPARDAWQKPAHVITLMKIDAGATVADIGTGTGYFLPLLSLAAGTKGKVLALDVEPEMIRYVKERAEKEKLGNVEARVIAPDDPGLGEATVDRALIVDTWHHIEARKAYSVKLAKGLKPGGMVFVIDFTMESSHGPPKEHRVAKETVVEELGAGGLTASVVKSELPDQYVVVGKK